jgi:uncharacterized protein (TIRG00374 family)
MIVAGTGQFFISGFFNGVILKPCSIVIKVRELFAIAVMTSIGNYILPFRGGLGLRAIYLKKKYNFPYSYFMSGMMGIFLIFFLTNSLLGLGSLMLLYCYRGVVSPALYFIFGFVLLLVFLPFLAYFKDFSYSRKIKPLENDTPLYFFLSKNHAGWLALLLQKLSEFLARAIKGWLQISRNPTAIFQLVLLTLLNCAANTVLLYYGFLSSSVKPDILGLLMISSLLSVSGLVNITPAGLGIQEAAIVFSSGVLGISMTQSLMASLFVRFVSIALAVTLAPFFSHYLSNGNGLVPPGKIIPEA